MVTSATYTYDPQISEIFEEAFEMAGIDPAAIGNRHIKSAQRSLRLILNSEWSTIGIRRWMIVQTTQALTVGLSQFTLPVGAIDVVSMVLRRNSRDTEMYRISQDEYINIVDKNYIGRPDRFYVDRQQPLAGKIVRIWQRAENATDVILYDYLRQIQDPGNLQNTPQVPAYAIDALTLGLATRLAFKFAPDRYTALNVMYRGPNPNSIGGALDRMRQEDRDRSDITISGDFLAARVPR